MVCNKYNEDGAKYLFKAIDNTNVDITTFSDKELGDLIHVGMLEEIDELKKANVELQKEANLFKDQFNELEVEYFDLKSKYENLERYAPKPFKFIEADDVEDGDEYHVISMLSEDYGEYIDIIYIKDKIRDLGIHQTYDLARQIYLALLKGDISNFKDAKYNDSPYCEYYDDYW